MRAVPFAAVALVVATVAAPTTSAEPAIAPSSNTTWYTIVTGTGAPFGYASREIAQRADGRDTTDLQVVDIREQGGQWNRITSRTVTSEDAAGNTFFVSSHILTGRLWSRIDASIANGSAAITRVTPGERGRPATIALPHGVRFDSGDGLLPSWDPAATPRLVFDNFDIDSMAVEHVVIEAASSARDAQGRLSALRKRFAGPALTSVVRLIIDREGRIVETVQPVFGTTISVREADREAALKPHPPYQVMPSVMTKSPFLIAHSAMGGHIRYRFGFRDGMAFALPQTGEQRVKAEGDAMTVDICAECGPGLPTDRAFLDDALKPTPWMQSDDPKIKDIVASVASVGTETHKMELLAQKTQKLVGRVDFAGHFSALEVLTRRAGDCTETSVLLATLGRAAGIPTRVANGVVYSRMRYHGMSNVFIPHSWTLAYVDGKWRSFDGALTGFDATYIAINISDGDWKSIESASQLASLLRWESMAEVRARPAT